MLFNNVNIFLWTCIGLTFGATLKDRIDFLELQVSRESYKTRTDIMELRELLSKINSSDSVGTGGDVGIDNLFVAKELNTFNQRIDDFVQDQRERSNAMVRAIAEEKAMTRKLIKIIRDLADSNAQSVLEIETALNVNENERDNFKKEWNNFQVGINNNIAQINQRTDTLETMLDNFDGTLVIHGGEKKPPCPENWFQNEDTCYFYEKNEALSWYGAAIRCHDFGGKLAEPDTALKMRYILDSADDNNIWLGATDEDKEGTWMWAHLQKPVEFAIWQAGQPNNLNHKQHCMEIGLSKLNDESCMAENRYLCEQPVHH